MTPEQWTRVRGVLERALQRPEAERVDYVRSSTAGDAALRASVLRFLDSAEPCEAFLESPLAPGGRRRESGGREGRAPSRRYR